MIKKRSFTLFTRLSLGILGCFAGVVTLSEETIFSEQDLTQLINSCEACHGPAGQSSNPLWPNLAGQKSIYLANQIISFREGARQSLEMNSLVTDFSDKKIERLAEYFSNEQPTVAANGDPALVAKGENGAAYCLPCHGMRGIPANPEWPALAGQQAEYLYQQLRAFRNGSRSNTIMNDIVANYEDDRLKQLAAYYSQLGNP